MRCRCQLLVAFCRIFLGEKVGARELVSADIGGSFWSNGRVGIRRAGALITFYSFFNFLKG